MFAPNARLTICSLVCSAFIGLPSARAGDDRKDSEPKHDPLIVMFQEKGPEIVKYLDKMNLVNVGVLKFRVQRVGEDMSDNVGELNRNMADHLEVALVQAAKLPMEGQTERFRLIKKASEKIAKQKKKEYTHLTPEGRKLFFKITNYELAWGKDTVEADAFITGEVIFDKERTVRIQFKIFGRDGEMKNLLEEITMTPTFRMLTNAGYSVALAEDMLKKKDVGNLLVGGTFTIPTVQANKNPDLVIHKTPDLTLADDPFKSPVRVEIRYNGVTQKIKNGSIPEPAKDDVITILLENPTEHTFAVLVRVNGLNSIYPETPCLDPRLCHKWILEKGKKLLIKGFQSDLSSYNEFKVLSPQESLKNEVNYGNDVGLIQIVTYKGEIDTVDPEIKLAENRNNNDIEKYAITRGTLTFGKGAAPKTLEELQGHLKNTGKLFSGAPRGLISKSAETQPNEVVKKYFRNEGEVQNASIRYYSSKAR
jgi:hypothetical protein